MVAKQSQERPDVSVLLPVYNGADALRETLESILAQDLQSFEVVVVDDGSTDATVEVAREFESPRVKYLRLSQNLGRGAARCRGLEIATGRYIAICDAGDTCLPGRLERQLTTLQSNEHVQVCSGQMLQVAKGGKLRVDNPFPTSPDAIADAFDRGHMGIAHATCLIRSEVFETIGSYHPELRRCEDLHLMIRVKQHYGPEAFAALVDPLVVYDRPSRTTWDYWKSNARYRRLALKLLEGESRDLQGTLSPSLARTLADYIKWILVTARDDFRRCWRPDR